MKSPFHTDRDSVDTKGICLPCGWTKFGAHNVKSGKLCLKCGHFRCHKHFKKHECCKEAR